MVKFLLAVLLLIARRDALAQRLVVTTDTVHLDVSSFAQPGNRLHLLDAVKYKGDLYCFLARDLSYDLEHTKRYFMVYTARDHKWTEYEMPQELKWKVRFEFFKRSDSLLACAEDDSTGFYFEPVTKKWIRAGAVRAPCYQDEDFIVNRQDRGEWGNWIWFTDRHTGKQYFLQAYGWPIRLHETYYLCSSNSVLKIADPRKLPLATGPNRYETIVRSGRLPRLTAPISHAEMLFFDSSNHWLTPFSEIKVHLIRSMVIGDRLCHLYMDSTGTHLGVIDNRQIIPVQHLGRLDLLMSGISTNIFRMDEFMLDTLRIDYIVHNLDSLQYRASDGLQQIIELVVREGGNLSDSKLAGLEKAVGATEVRLEEEDTWMNAHPMDKPRFDSLKSRKFFLIENETITQYCSWNYSLDDDQPRMLSVEWSQTIPYNDYGYDIFPPFAFDVGSEGSLTERLFTAKQQQIIQIIDEATGVVAKKEKKGDVLTLDWALDNGVWVSLRGSTDFGFLKRIRLTAGFRNNEAFPIRE